jgi:hypothetical protein
MNSLWVKYESICTNCDSLFEITSMNPLVFEPACSCSDPHVIRINRYDVTELTEPHLDNVGTAHYN